MHRRHELIFDPVLGRKVHVWCFGHFGLPLLVFPSAAGFAHEWDRQGMVETLSHLVLAGKIKLYCPENNVSETWTSKTNTLGVCIEKHKAYEHFITKTLVPFIYRDCHAEKIPIAVSGASLGGYYAATFALKFPQVFNYALCMSGRYDLTHFTHGFSNDDIYYNNPLAFVPNLNGDELEKVRRHTHLTLVCGQGKFEEGCIEETIWLAERLQQKSISHTRDIWGLDVAHDWGWWKKQALLHLSHRFR